MLGFVILAIVFIFQNTQQTEIRGLIPEITMPLWPAVIGVGVIGLFCGGYLSRRRR
jgi:uncharacterized integral membrane protein